MTTVSTTLAAGPISLDQLAALSEEIAALVRAGVPLDRGLRDLAGETPGQLGKLAGSIGERLEQGHSLEQVVAGFRAGRLPAALESVARTAHRVSQLRRSIGLALIYPTVVLSLA